MLDNIKIMEGVKQMNVFLAGRHKLLFGKVAILYSFQRGPKARALAGICRQITGGFMKILVVCASIPMMCISTSQQSNYSINIYELAWRRLNVMEDSKVKSFGRYVYIVRREGLQISREELARRSGMISRNKLFYLENGLLKPKELNSKLRQNIEKALGLTYREFTRLWF